MCFKDFKRHLQKTEKLRNGCTNLFISFVKPHKAVSSDTISRWIKEVFKLCEIDVSVPAHSVRAIASSTAAATGIPINEILRAGGWTRESTFTNSY